MADISTKAPTTIRGFSLPPPSFPRLEFGASLRGIFRLWNDALKLAYMDPYTTLRRQPRIVPDDDLEGRDPTW
ncbi:hypothetical protein [Mesorhizobium sp. STM 4661]|uniref:hypothetical protein n=1 Tax=Mesorhizobium sp. STM 4661 TaxID=1297570 RepID=UPI0002BE6111|nr:hypothetical protein [Mesorhizobium sp. STM 4661]CCV13583.1 hypothetical protein MESS4_580061 [Mesorhizobium sp. STM 4661]